MKNISSIFRLRFHLFALLALFLFAGNCDRVPKRDFLLVVDTSGSMSGPRQTYAKVQKSLPKLLNTMAEGDTVTLITFDEEIRVGTTHTIKKEGDENAILSELGGQEAYGLYTDMTAMLAVVKSKMAELQSPDRKFYIIIFSDGLDDPPPNKRKDKVELSDFESPEEEKLSIRDDYIYYVSLGSLKDKGLESELKNLSGQVKVIDAARSNEGAGEGANGTGTTGDGSSASSGSEGGITATSGEDDVGIGAITEDIKRDSLFSNMKVLGIGAGAVVLGLLLLFLIFYGFYRYSNRHKLAGQLRYYEEGGPVSLSSTYSMGKLKRSKMAIGAHSGVDLKIRDLGIPQTVNFKSKKIRGETYLRPTGKTRGTLKFLDQKKKGLISSGDKFKLGNYIFEYRHGQENK